MILVAVLLHIVLGADAGHVLTIHFIIHAFDFLPGLSQLFMQTMSVLLLATSGSCQGNGVLSTLAN